MLQEESDQIADEGFVISDKNDGLVYPQETKVREVDGLVEPVALFLPGFAGVILAHPSIRRPETWTCFRSYIEE